MEEGLRGQLREQRACVWILVPPLVSCVMLTELLILSDSIPPSGK